jgi:putative membrane protein
MPRRKVAPEPFSPVSSEQMKRPRPTVDPIQPDAFIANAAMECMTDARLARLALAQEPSDAVRQFTVRLIEDCERTLLEITRVATRKNVPVPRLLDDEHENLLRRMGEKTGTDFNTAYVERIVLHHRHAITLFKRGQTVKNPEISALASRMLAMTEARIKLSRQLPANIDPLLDGGGLPRAQDDELRRARRADGEF